MEHSAAVPRPSSAASTVDVTVVVPCRDGAPFLDAMMSSVCSQSASPVHKVLADDGSADASAALATRGGWLVVPTGGTAAAGRGIAAGRNLAIAETESTFVAFLDADDWWEPDHLADCVALLEAHPDAVACFGSLRTTDDGTVRPVPVSIPRRTPFRALPSLLASNYVPVSAVVARRDAVTGRDGFRNEFQGVEDYDMWLRLAEIGPFIFRDAVSLNYRVHPGQISRNTRMLGVNALRVRREALERLRQAAPSGRIDDITRRAAATGWEESLDVLWYFGHFDEHSEWMSRYRETFEEVGLRLRSRTGLVGSLHHVARRLLGRIPR